MRTGCLLAVIVALGVITPAIADTSIKYIPDPLYGSFDPAAPSPMQEMLDLANQGDIRAQYILGDLYSKGKGGLSRNAAKSRGWFEKAARHGLPQAFIRLAADAKRRKQNIEAYQWYTLAQQDLPRGPWRDYAHAARDVLVKDKTLSNTDIDQAKKATALWRETARKLAPEETRLWAAQAVYGPSVPALKPSQKRVQ